MRFLVFVGASNTLAEAELHIQIPGSKSILPNTYLFEATDPESAAQLSSRLGSSIKLAHEMIGVSASPESVADLVKVKTFSVTDLRQFDQSAKLCQNVKNLRNAGRFILPKDQFGVSPIIISKHKIDEFFFDSSTDTVWKTIWVHDFAHWIKKDRHMPYANAKAGILPPKIARSMVNLVPFDGTKNYLVDPFCGSGRILIEAAELGYQVGGADISTNQARETQANLNFLGYSTEIKVLDATHLSELFRNVDVIVTEPFLGKPNPRPDQIKYLVPGLQKLYLGCLKDWLKVLKSGGYLVMVFPLFDDGRKVYKTSSVIDAKLELGYNLLKRDLVYSRPNADVRREIVVLQKR